MTSGSVSVWSDAVEQAAAIRSGAASAVELVERYLARIERLDPQLRAFVTVDVEGAVQSATAADDAVRSGAAELPPFHGVTITIKDDTDVAGLPTTHSCKALVDHVPEVDDPLVGRLRAAGFIVLGKTNVPEFCTSMTSSELNGTCRNPWDPERTPAGSSGGAASSLAAGLCAVAHGTDGAGSVRVPASFCGLVGTKPTRGLVSFGPEAGDAYYGTAVDGILSRTVRDAEAVLAVYAGAEPDGPTSTRSVATSGGRAGEPVAEAVARGLRIAVSTTPPWGVVEDECAGAARAVADTLAALGHDVLERTPDWSVIFGSMLGPMSVPGLAALVGLDDIELLEPRNRPMLREMRELTVVEHARWVEGLRAASRELLRFWDDVDVLVTPTAGSVPMSVSWVSWDLERDEHSGRFATFANFAQPFNLSGQPALSLPLAWSADGLPIGVQLAGRRFDEALLFALARQLEEAVPWRDRHPALAVDPPRG